MPSLLTVLLRFFLLVAGLIFAASLAFAFALVFVVWLLRAAWARLTGKQVAPVSMRFHPRRGLARMDLAQRAGEVVDVEPREPGQRLPN